MYTSRGFHRVKGEDPPDWNTFVSFSSSPDLSDLRGALVLSRDEIANYGHQRDDLILECTYDNQKCNMRYPFYNLILVYSSIIIINFLT